MLKTQRNVLSKLVLIAAIFFSIASADQAFARSCEVSMLVIEGLSKALHNSKSDEAKAFVTSELEKKGYRIVDRKFQSGDMRIILGRSIEHVQKPQMQGYSKNPILAKLEQRIEKMTSDYIDATSRLVSLTYVEEFAKPNVSKRLVVALDYKKQGLFSISYKKDLQAIEWSLEQIPNCHNLK